jgi:hypothetical protein
MGRQAHAISSAWQRGEIPSLVGAACLQSVGYQGFFGAGIGIEMALIGPGS